MAEYNAVTGVSGLVSGAATGAAIGSVIPVVGTAVGAVVGGVLGAVGGFGGGGGAGLQDPMGIAKRAAIAEGLVPAGKVGAEVFKSLLVAGDRRATELYLQYGGNPNKFGAGFLAPRAQVAPGVTIAPEDPCACDPRPLQLLALLVQALQSEQGGAIQGGFGPNPRGRVIVG